MYIQKSLFNLIGELFPSCEHHTVLKISKQKCVLVTINSTAKHWAAQWVMDLVQIKDCTDHVTLLINKFGFGAILGKSLNRGKNCASACAVKRLQSGWSVFLTEVDWLSLNFLPGHRHAQLKSVWLPVDTLLSDEMQVNSLRLFRSVWAAKAWWLIMRYLWMDLAGRHKAFLTSNKSTSPHTFFIFTSVLYECGLIKACCNSKYIMMQQAVTTYLLISY